MHHIETKLTISNKNGLTTLSYIKQRQFIHILNIHNGKNSCKKLFFKKEGTCWVQGIFQLITPTNSRDFSWSRPLNHEIPVGHAHWITRFQQVTPTESRDSNWSRPLVHKRGILHAVGDLLGAEGEFRVLSEHPLPHGREPLGQELLLQGGGERQARLLLLFAN